MNIHTVLGRYYTGRKIERTRSAAPRSPTSSPAAPPASDDLAARFALWRGTHPALTLGDFRFLADDLGFDPARPLHTVTSARIRSAERQTVDLVMADDERLIAVVTTAGFAPTAAPQPIEDLWHDDVPIWFFGRMQPRHRDDRPVRDIQFVARSAVDGVARDALLQFADE